MGCCVSSVEDEKARKRGKKPPSSSQERERSLDNLETATTAAAAQPMTSNVAGNEDPDARAPPPPRSDRYAVAAAATEPGPADPSGGSQTLRAAPPESPPKVAPPSAVIPPPLVVPQAARRGGGDSLVKSAEEQEEERKMRLALRAELDREGRGRPQNGGPNTLFGGTGAGGGQSSPTFFIDDVPVIADDEIEVQIFDEAMDISPAARASPGAPENAHAPPSPSYRSSSIGVTLPTQTWYGSHRFTSPTAVLWYQRDGFVHIEIRPCHAATVGYSFVPPFTIHYNDQVDGPLSAFSLGSGGSDSTAEGYAAVDAAADGGKESPAASQHGSTSGAPSAPPANAENGGGGGPLPLAARGSVPPSPPLRSATGSGSLSKYCAVVLHLFEDVKDVAFDVNKEKNCLVIRARKSNPTARWSRLLRGGTLAEYQAIPFIQRDNTREEDDEQPLADVI